MKRLFRSAVIASLVFALAGCYGVEGLISIGEDTGTGATVTIDMAQGVDMSLFDGDVDRARAYVSERFGNEWGKSTLPAGDIFAVMVLSQTLETPASFSDEFGNTIEVTRGTAEQRPDGRPEYTVSMSLELVEPVENTEFVGVGFILEYPTDWQLRVISDGGAAITSAAPGRANLRFATPGEYKPLIVLFPPWEPPPAEEAAEPQQIAEPEEEIQGEEPPAAEPEDSGSGGLIDNRDLDAAVAEAETTEEEELAVEGALAEAVTEITRDGGMVEVEGSRFPARSLTGIIPAGATVEVLGIGESYLFVQEVEEPASSTGLWIVIGVLGLLLIGAIVAIVLVVRSRKSPSEAIGT